MRTCSIWLMVYASGHFRVSLWMRWCGKYVELTTRFLLLAKSINHWPLWLHSSWRLCPPLVLRRRISFPIFPRIFWHYLLGVSQMVRGWKKWILIRIALNLSLIDLKSCLLTINTSPNFLWAHVLPLLKIVCEFISLISLTIQFVSWMQSRLICKFRPVEGRALTAPGLFFILKHTTETEFTRTGLSMHK